MTPEKSRSATLRPSSYHTDDDFCRDNVLDAESVRSQILNVADKSAKSDPALGTPRSRLRMGSAANVFETKT